MYQRFLEIATYASTSDIQDERSVATMFNKRCTAYYKIKTTGKSLTCCYTFFKKN